MDEQNQPRDETPAGQDDFQQIKGIGPSIAQILVDLGIHSFDELAAFTPDRLADLLKDRIPVISPQQIKGKDWIGQAHSLALAKQDTTETPEQSSDQRQDRGKETAKSPRESWRELADFFVSFGYTTRPDGTEQLQTKIHHSQADRLEQWDGISAQRLIEWMLTQANLPVPAAPEDVSPEDVVEEPSEETEPAKAAQLEIADLWVTETQAPLTQGESQLLNALQAEARLILSGPEAMDLADESIPFTMDFYLVNSENNHSELVASTGKALTPGQVVYEEKEAFPIPPVGRYQLFVVARLSPPGMLVTHLQGPTIRVEPHSQKNASSMRNQGAAT
jgi:hypothetical protein